jgi:hypothetical protein
MIADQTVVQQILQPREEILRRLIKGAWGKWWKNPDRLQLSLQRTRACMVHNFIVTDAPAAFSGDTGIHIENRDETSFFYARLDAVKDEIVNFRIKKGDQRGISSNNETQTSLLFTDPESAQPELPGMPRMHRVDVVYILNATETQIAGIKVIARDHDKIVWEYSIFPAEEADNVAPLTPPAPPRPPLPPAADNVIKLPSSRKNSKKDK